MFSLHRFMRLFFTKHCIFKGYLNNFILKTKENRERKLAFIWNNNEWAAWPHSEEKKRRRINQRCENFQKMCQVESINHLNTKKTSTNVIEISNFVLNRKSNASQLKFHTLSSTLMVRLITAVNKYKKWEEINHLKTRNVVKFYTLSSP